MSKKPRTASVEDSTILAAVRGYFRYEYDWQAREMLEEIRNDYVRAKEQDDCTGLEFPTVRLWVSGFGVTKEEKAEGYGGHFVRLSIKPIEGGKWTIAAEKLVVPLARHPKKARVRPRHPNWWHPALQAVETGKVFDGVAIARAQLQQLHMEYPDATIPGKDVVHVLVYSRDKNTPEAPPIQKITIKIKPLANGGAKLVIRDKPRKKKTPAPLPEATPPQEPQGKFTAMVKKKRTGKKT